VQRNVGVAMTQRVVGDRVGNLDRAVACFTDAAQVMTPEAMPYDSSVVQQDLETALAERAAAVSSRARERPRPACRLA
jgi:hypothetical protein